MKDARARLEKLRTDAADCDMIANLTTIQSKRGTFQRLAATYREMAADLERLIKSGDLPGDLGI